MDTYSQNILAFEFHSPKRNKKFTPDPLYLNKCPSFSNVKNLNERLIDSDSESEKITPKPENDEENISLSPEREIQKLPPANTAYVNKPHDYFAQLRKDIGIAYDVRPSQRTRASMKESIVSPISIDKSRRGVRSRIRGNGPGKQTDKLGLGFSRILSPSPSRNSPRYERYLSPNTVRNEYYNSTYNFYSTEYCDKAHIAGLLQQIKSFEEENFRLKEKLKKREDQLEELKNEEN